MKSLKTFGIIFAVLSGLIACDPISGSLQVSHPFSVRTTSTNICTGDMWPCDDNGKIETLQPGSYNMQIQQFGGNTIRIYLKLKKQQVPVDLNISSGREIPATGSLVLSSQETGQPFDLQAQTQTQVSETEPRRELEDCEITWTERVCGIKPGGSNGKPVHSCQDVKYSRPGLRDVEYFYRTTTQHMQAQILDRGSQVASFSGSRSDTDKIYLYKGACLERMRW